MSVFHCFNCDIDFDSDFHEIYLINDIEACEDCYMDEIDRNKEIKQITINNHIHLSEESSST